MYLFAHLYYTDVLSLTAVLGLILFNLKQRHNVAAVFGKLRNIRRYNGIQSTSFVSYLQAYSVY